MMTATAVLLLVMLALRTINENSSVPHGSSKCFPLEVLLLLTSKYSSFSSKKKSSSPWTEEINGLKKAEDVGREKFDSVHQDLTQQ